MPNQIAMPQLVARLTTVSLLAFLVFLHLAIYRLISETG